MATAEQPRLGLTDQEVAAVRRLLSREPNELEWAIIDAEWSEHSSYKSSKALLRLFPTSGRRVVLGPGYDAGVVDVGGGYVATVHIESHNHPSAVDPYGGSSTGIGGVLRDILSMGSRPIALVDMLRFGEISESSHSRWLFKNVVRGIADYGNCVGIPTVAGDVEFDSSFEKNCLVDVACVGIGRKKELILGEARNPGDIVLLAGGSTGRDGIRGATFASKNLADTAESDRASVQVPDPFMKKLLLDALLEAAPTGLINGMKDLGGGGLSTGLSEIAAKGETGVDVELTEVPLREADMTPTEIMTSESQERMLLMLAEKRSEPVLSILRKYEVPYSVIGKVTDTGRLTVRLRGRVVADLPARVVTEAPLIEREARKPVRAEGRSRVPPEMDAGRSLLRLLSSQSICSRRWVYEQYDHEVGVRTVLKPGWGDAAVVRIPNGSMLAIKGDGNSKHCHLDPYNGAAGCVAEACRNVVAVGAEPIAMVDHLQFGDPSDPEVYWTFSESVRGMADYCRGARLPVVGGKVSFYNEDETTKRAIKPAPIAMVVGLIPNQSRVAGMGFKKDGESIFVLGHTRPEMGGSEYYGLLHGRAGGEVPRANAKADLRLYRWMLRVIRGGLVNAVHDCSKGGLGVSLAEMCFGSRLGADVDVSLLPAGEGMRTDELLFSESHGRFLLSTQDGEGLEALLAASGLEYARIGTAGGGDLVLSRNGGSVARLALERLAKAWEGSIPRLMD